MTTPAILISEVGPRDGLQSVKATMPTADKLRWIDALRHAGIHNHARVKIEYVEHKPTFSLT